MASRPGPNTTASKIAALEEGYRNIGREVGALREDFAQFARDVRGELHSRDRTQWSPLIAAVSVVVAIIGGLITLGAQGPMRDLDRHNEEIGRVMNSVQQIRTTRFTPEDGLDLLARFEGRLARVESRARAFTEEQRDVSRAAVAELRRDLHELTGRVFDHQKDGHPERVLERVDGVAKRVDALEIRLFGPGAPNK